MVTPPPVASCFNVLKDAEHSLTLNKPNIFLKWFLPVPERISSQEIKEKQYNLIIDGVKQKNESTFTHQTLKV